MGRPVMLSNGRMLVGLDESGLVHDFYYPYVGLENLTTSRSMQHKIGVWVEGQFSWVDDGSWNINVDFETNALVSKINMTNEELMVELVFSDYVDLSYNAFFRHIEVLNKSDKDREIRVFMHQVFEISRQGRADTAMYVPDSKYLLDYKGRCCLLIAGVADNSQDFDQFAVGSYAIEGKSGTFKDAEDGELSGNLVEHGGVDSVIRFSKHVPANEKFTIDYWIVAENDQQSAQMIHERIKRSSFAERLEQTRIMWDHWLRPAEAKLSRLSTKEKENVLKSLLIIKAHCDARGSILASGDSSIFNYGRDYYCYCWPRDAAYALWPLIRLGLYDEALRFFDFARDTLHRDGYLKHKYQPDRAIGSTWHPLVHGNSKELAIQEDETASVLFMMGEYYEITQDQHMVYDYYDSFIKPAADFMTKFVDASTSLPHASYDLWEEKFLTTTYTVSTVIGGLEAAVELANAIGKRSDTAEWQRASRTMRSSLDQLYNEDGGYFRKGYLLKEDGSKRFDDTVDASSLHGVFMFAKLPENDPRLISTADKVRNTLKDTSKIGGVIRYEDDYYFRQGDKHIGNPWIVCTMWFAQYSIYQNDMETASDALRWVEDRMIGSGVLSEQYHPDNGEPLSVAPLVWSHAEYINTLLDLYKI